MTKVDPDLRGFTGGFAAGHWGFLVPFKNKEADGEYAGKMVRFDLRTFDHAGVTVSPWYIYRCIVRLFSPLLHASIR